jgi:branched-chain amino acid aminotransferase
MMSSQNYAFFQDMYVPVEKANVNITTHAFMYGTAVFEGVRAYWNHELEESYLFKLKEHFVRVFESMKIMHLNCKYSVEELCGIVVELLKKNSPRTDMYIRPCIYKCGTKISPGLDHIASDICIFTTPLGDYFGDGFDGLKVQVSSWRRVEDNAIPARAKIVGAYANTALAITDAHLAGFDDCIMLSECGHVSEGSAMNLFVVKNGELATPGGADNILEGITRSTIITLATDELKLKTTCRTIDRSELYTADELFCTGTGAQVTPIIEVDRRPVGTGGTGAITAKLRDLYINTCRGKTPRYHHWLTPVFNRSETAPVSSSTSTAVSASA